MKIFGIQFFPRKLKVTVTMHSGSSFYFYCDSYEYKVKSSLSYKNGIALYGSKLPNHNIIFDIECVEMIHHEEVRIYRIYKA